MRHAWVVLAASALWALACGDSGTSDGNEGGAGGAENGSGGASHVGGNAGGPSGGGGQSNSNCVLGSGKLDSCTLQ